MDVAGVDWVDQRAMVDSVLPRASRLVDPPVANVDHALLVFALERPPLEAKQLTRFLVSMEATGVPFTLVLNKCDLADETTREDWRARLEQWGYEPRLVSVATGEGVDELEAELARGMRARLEAEAEEGETTEDETSATSTRARVTVLAGPSGVGKSSLINRLRAGSRLALALAEAGEIVAEDQDENENDDDDDDDDCSSSPEPGDDDSDSDADADADEKPSRFVTDVDISGGGGGARGAIVVEGLELQSVKAVSAKLGRGRHTTRHVTLLPLRSGGLLADTPGFGYPSLESLTVAELGDCFPEIVRARDEAGACKFANCTHRDEPGCAVDEVMPWEEDRYDMYCDIFDEVEAMERAEREAGYKRESRVRYKSGKGGGGGGGGAGAGAAAGAGAGAGGGAPRRGRRGGGRDARRGDDDDAGTRTSRGPKGSANRRMEPKLDTKSNRRQSRRSFNMETADMEAAEGTWFDEDDEWADEDDEDEGEGDFGRRAGRSGGRGRR